MDEPLRVLVIPSWYGTGRTHLGIFFRDQVEALREQGHRVDVVALNMVSPFQFVRSLLRSLLTGAKGFIHEGVACAPALLPAGLPVNFWLYRRLLTAKLKRYLANEGRPQVVHAHAAFYGGAVATEFFGRLGIPVVLTEHNSAIRAATLKGWRLDLARSTYLGCSRVVAVSRYLADEVNKVAAKRLCVDVIPNICSSEFAAPGAEPDLDRPFTYLNVGQFDRNKGQRRLIEAFARVDPGSRLVMVGEGPGLPKIRAQIEALSLEGRIDIRPFVSRSELRRLMDASDAVVISSEVETFGLVAVEGLARGLVVVSTPCGGPNDVIAGGAGVLAVDHGAASLGDAMRKAQCLVGAGSRDRYRRMAVSRYAPDVVAGQLAAVFNRVVTGCAS
ncbi:MAG: glycosyltransferase [Gammaproteobacteria bacterium]|nr:glycosyltransferase [Gammaproteobacteria bacterium]